MSEIQTPDDEPIDFDELKRRRHENLNSAISSIAKGFAKRHGTAVDKVFVHVSTGPNTNECYCACSSGGPCQHEFGGWRQFEDGNGGEQICSRCGMGAMAHSLHTGD